MNRWSEGNRFELLENGEQFFPSVFEAISGAKAEALVETFILFEDKVGLALRDALTRAAAAGAQVHLTIDGYGSPSLSAEFITSLTRAGVNVHVFDPGPKIWGMRTNLFRRMHRKIVVVDGQTAFIGGINYSADHLGDFGPEAKQDYAVKIQGPLVAEIHHFARKALASGIRNGRPKPHPRWLAWLLGAGGKKQAESSDEREAIQPPNFPIPASQGPAKALLATRDNSRHTNDIERHYRVAIRAARQRVVIANAYFFPGYRLIREMRRAALRGVEVSLILQGQPDMPIVKVAAELLYHHLITSGVKIHEYRERPLHGKVALADDAWATVGSSNLDPLSLSLNLEANVVINDRGFNATLSARLERLMSQSCKLIAATDLPPVNSWVVARSFLVFHLLRHYPAWMSLLPSHAPRLSPAQSLIKASEPGVSPSGAD